MLSVCEQGVAEWLHVEADGGGGGSPRRRRERSQHASLPRNPAAGDPVLIWGAESAPLCFLGRKPSKQLPRDKPAGACQWLPSAPLEFSDSSGLHDLVSF